MKTPDQLLTDLNRFEDVNSAIAIHKEAGAYIKRFKEVQAQALDCARAELESDGVLHHKMDGVGSAGWTEPKRAKLDEAKWKELCQEDEYLKVIQVQADRTRRALEDAQAERGCFVLPESRFYIK